MFKCRLCGGSDLHVLLYFPQIPLANEYVTELWSEYTSHDLTFGMCRECELLQIAEVLPHAILFGSNYPWVSGTSRTNQEYCRRFAQDCRKHRKRRKARVLEIGCNDGTLLDCFDIAGWETFGVDPSAAGANKDNVRNAPWSSALANDLFGSQSEKPHLIVARNVIGHVSDPVDFVDGIATALAENGTAIIESPYAGFLRDQLQYDTVFHEHVCYFTITTLQRLFDVVDMAITNVAWSPMNGGSFVCEVKHGHTGSTAAEEIKALEDVNGLHRPSMWRGFQTSVEQSLKCFANTLNVYRQEDIDVAAYGSAAKFNTLLHMANISNDHIRYMVDDNKLKHNKALAHADIPVIGFDKAMKDPPQVMVVGAWNYADEINKRLRLHNYTGELLLPLPFPRHY